MDVLLKTYYTLLPIIATALVGWVGTILKDQKKREQQREEDNKKKYEELDNIRRSTSEGVKLILRYMLNRYHTEYMIQGKITYSQYKDWMELYAAYRALNGNSIAVDWNKDVEELDKCDYPDGPSPFERMMRYTVGRDDNDE